MSRRDHKQYSNFHAEVVDVLVHDERTVCFRGRAGGTQDRPITTRSYEYPPTGKAYTFEFLCWLQTTDGLITRAIYAFNPLSIWPQRGHISSP